MPKRSKADHALPEAALEALRMLGENIRAARKAKGIHQKDLAARSLMTPARLRRLESGDPFVGLGALAQVLYVLELEADLAEVATATVSRSPVRVCSFSNSPFESASRFLRPVEIKKNDLDF